MQQNSNKYTSLAIEYKKRLNDVIDAAYNGSPKLAKYKRFVVECNNKQTRFLGLCHLDKVPTVIELTHIETVETRQLMVTAIHEISHHVEYVDNGSSGHQATFYDRHKKLLFAAFDLELLDPSDVVESQKNAGRNNNKLARMMAEYRPNPIKTNSEAFTIRVYDAYDFKDVLKSRGYRYNPIDQSWMKDFDGPTSEVVDLVSAGIPLDSIKTSDTATISKMKVNIRIGGSEFEQKDDFNSNEFRWSKQNREWTKMVFVEDLVSELFRVRDLFSKYPKLHGYVDSHELRSYNGYFQYYDHKERTWMKMYPPTFVKRMYNQTN